MPTRHLLCLLMAIFVAACSAPQTRILHQQHATLTLRPNIDLQAVPFFAQNTHQCGPAALATMLQYSNVNVTPEQLVAEVYVPNRHGSFALEMVASARHHGRLAYPLAANLNAIFAALDAGFPVLVLQNNGLAIYPVWHFAVVVGVDYQHEQLLLRSGLDQRLILPFSTFEHTWARSNYWATLIVDPAQLPAWLEADKTLQQLSSMEKYGSVRAAQSGYEQATRHWPAQPAAWLGLGNSSVTLGEMERAEQAFRQLLQRFPDNGAGLNNLADLLLHQGRAQEALPFAEQAAKVLAIPATQETLTSVRAALNKP